MRNILLSLFLVLIGFLSACATTNEPSEAYKGETQQQIYQHGKNALRDGNFGEAVRRFEALDIQYPYGAETEYAQLYLIYGYYMKEDYPLAVAAADRFIHTHPTNPHIDYVYYMKGLANYYQNLGTIERFFAVDLATRDLSQIQKSYNDFNNLVMQFPRSRYAPSAHQFLIYLRNVLANHQLGIAQYYYQRKAYVAAANRASYLVAHYQGAPAVIDGLVLLAKSYHRLGLTKLTQDTLLVLHYNYPDKKVDFERG